VAGYVIDIDNHRPGEVKFVYTMEVSYHTS